MREGADLPEADSLWNEEQQGEQDMHKIKKGADLPEADSLWIEEQQGEQDTQRHTKLKRPSSRGA